MVHVYRLSESALKTVSAASKIATEVLLPNAADVDAQSRYPAESLKALGAGWVMAPTVDHLNDFIGRALTGLPLF